MHFNWIDIPDTLDQVEALKSTRRSVAAIPEPLGTAAFAYGDNFLDIEQYATIGHEALVNIGTSFAVICVIVVVLLASPVGSLVTFVCVTSTIVDLIGFMHFRGTYIDSVAVIFLVISLGLAVDYSVHVAHGFLQARESDMETRLKQTLTVWHLISACFCSCCSVPSSAGHVCIALTHGSPDCWGTGSRSPRPCLDMPAPHQTGMRGFQAVCSALSCGLQASGVLSWQRRCRRRELRSSTAQ